MLLKFAAILPVFLAPPDMRISWHDNSRQAVDIAVSAEDELLERCAKSGLEVRYRYELYFCRRRTGWFSACRDRRLVIHSMQYDAISQSYKVTRDRHGDEDPAERSTVSSPGEAHDAVARVRELPVSLLAHADLDSSNLERHFISLRVLASCRGEYSETLARIGSVLTLGLVTVSAFNSGWIDFDLDSGTAG